MRFFTVVMLAGVAILAAGCFSYPRDWERKPNPPISTAPKPAGAAPVAAAATNVIRTTVAVRPVVPPAPPAKAPAAVPGRPAAAPTLVTRTGTTHAAFAPGVGITKTPAPELNNQARSTLGQSSSGAVRRAHSHFNDAAAEKNFLDLVAEKEWALDALRVLDRMIGEKNAQRLRFEKSLQDQFAIDPKARYQFDSQTREIHRVVAARTANAPGEIQLHRKLENDDEVRTFASMAAAKQMAIAQMSDLQLIVQEKQMTIDAVDRRLEAEYRIAKDQTYDYNPATKTLYIIAKETGLRPGFPAPQAAGSP